MHHFVRDSIRTTTFLCALSLGLTSNTLVAGSALAAPELPGIFGGGGGAGSANLLLGKLRLPLLHLAHVGCPCVGTLGQPHTTQVGPITIPGLLTVGLTQAASLASKTKTTALNSDSASLSQLSVLNGLITADLIQANAGVAATPTSMTASAAGSTFANLVIAGTPVDPNVPPNTVIPLAGLGSVTVNKVKQARHGKNDIVIAVAMLQIDVLEDNSFGLPIGAVITLGRATAEYNRAQPGAITKSSASVASANPLARTVLPELGHVTSVGVGNCLGSGGTTREKQFAGINQPLISLGVATVTAFGGPTGGNTSMSQGTSNLANISMLGGLITADGINSVATETAVGNKVTGSTAGTQFVNLSVLGVPIPLDPAPNTKISLPLLGTVVLNEQSAVGHGRRGVTGVNALHLYADQVNLFGLPIGAEVILGHAAASAVVPVQ